MQPIHAPMTGISAVTEMNTLMLSLIHIFTQAASMDYAPIFFGVDGMDGILTMEGFDTSLAEGVLPLTPFSADAKDEKTVNSVTKYVELYGDCLLYTSRCV